MEERLEEDLETSEKTNMEASVEEVPQADLGSNNRACMEGYTSSSLEEDLETSLEGD